MNMNGRKRRKRRRRSYRRWFAKKNKAEKSRSNNIQKSNKLGGDGNVAELGNSSATSGTRNQNIAKIFSNKNELEDKQKIAKELQKIREHIILELVDSIRLAKRVDMCSLCSTHNTGKVLYTG